MDNEIFKGTKAAQFVALIENFAANYAERQISELLAAILNESGYEKNAADRRKSGTSG